MKDLKRIEFNLLSFLRIRIMSAVVALFQLRLYAIPPDRPAFWVPNSPEFVVLPLPK